MGEKYMCNEQKNVYIIELDMKNKSVEDIAREAAMQIVGITDALIEQQKASRNNREDVGGVQNERMDDRDRKYID